MSPTRLVWRLITYRPHLYLGSALCASIMFYVFPLIPGLIAQQVFDRLSGNAAATPGLWVFIVLLLVGGVGQFFFLMGAGWFESSTGRIAAGLLICNLFERVMARPGGRAVRTSSGEAVSRFRDDVQAIMRFLTWTVDPLGQAFVFAVAIFLLGRINFIFTFTVFVPLMAVILLVNVSAKRIQRYRKDRQTSIGGVTNFLGEILAAVSAVKAAGAEERVVDHFRDLNEERRRSTVTDLLFTQILMAVSSNAGNIGTGVLLLLAAGEMRSGSFTVGDFAIFVSYLGWLTVVTGMFGNFLTLYRQVSISFDRLAFLIPDDHREELVRHRPIFYRGPLPDAPQPKVDDIPRLARLEAHNLSVRYGDDEDEAIRDVSLRVDKGEFVVVTGRIGSGKSTLLRTVLGLLPTSSGRLLWNGRVVDDPAEFMIPPRVAYTAQMPRLFTETVRHNILQGLPESDGRLGRAIESAVLAKDLADLDEGLETMVGSRGVRLSGGQLHRAAAARMFVREPDLLVFDDLSSALDIETETLLWEQIRPESGGGEGHTCLVVSHRRAALRRADRIVVLQNGRVAGTGTLEELLRTSPEMQRLWHGEMIAERDGAAAEG